jgi:hypothetical protein
MGEQPQAGDELAVPAHPPANQDHHDLNSEEGGGYIVRDRGIRRIRGREREGGDRAKVGKQAVDEEERGFNPDMLPRHNALDALNQRVILGTGRHLGTLVSIHEVSETQSKSADADEIPDGFSDGERGE